jgi:hypothetical protein
MAELSSSQILAAVAQDRRLQGFLRDGKLDHLPAKWSRRRQLLMQVAQAFEPGIRYPEREVNRRLAAIHPDYAMMRRYLVDEQLMDRAGGCGEYWRAGGPVLS